MTKGTQRKLDINQSSKISKLLIQQFSNKVVGQDKATQVLVDMFDAFQSGFGDHTRPAGIALFLGPICTGKTHVVESFAEAIFGTKKACLRIDCAEFQHSHEISKLIGSPPGYLGHRETSPALTQEALDLHHTSAVKLSIVLFDEIEKASDSLWSLLLGIMDKATLTLGDNRKVNFSNTIIVLTSNLGAREMSNRGIGFVDPTDEMDHVRLEKIALSAAKSKFTPEFMNRLQHVITFKTLTKEQMELIVSMELRDLEFRLFAASSPLLTEPMQRQLQQSSLLPRFTLAVSPKARRTLLAEGFDKSYG